jgi:uncharacterized protein (DUF1015 family)
MAEVIPFKGSLFNIAKVSRKLGEELLCPPYDIITPESQESFYRNSPYNIVRIDFGKELSDDNSNENRYTRARAYLNQWIHDDVLITNGSPYFYAYEMAYTLGERELSLKGFIGLVRLEELGKGTIYPHECTHDKPKKDRLELLKVCNANISPIFSLYNSPERKTSALLSEICRKKPYIAAPDMDNAVHRLWKISDANDIQVIQKELADKTVFIADGHHRYETALDYQRERNSRKDSEKPMPHNYVMMFLANMSDEGLTILPTHRLARTIPDNTLDRLSAQFAVKKITGGLRIVDLLAEKVNSLGFYQGDADTWYLLEYSGQDLLEIPEALRNLDVTILHELVFKRLLQADDIGYEMDEKKTVRLVQDRHYSAAFFLNPTPVSEVEHVALASLRMPPKSTYFYPKLLTGMVLNIFDNAF